MGGILRVCEGVVIGVAADAVATDETEDEEDEEEHGEGTCACCDADDGGAW